MIVQALAPGRTRLTQLHRRLPGVSTSVLEQHLRRMVATNLVTRTRHEKSPPRVEVELTDCGRELLEISGMLARWGMRNHWSEPADRERVDVGALLRMLPVLLEGHPGLPDGATVEAQVASVHAVIVVLYHVDGGRLEIDGIIEHEPGIQPPRSDSAAAEDGHRSDGISVPSRATVCLWGDEQAWIAALGPAGDYKHLRFDGKAKLARQMLDGLPRQASSP
jgi:DNA-binding HxlR family transcriptional regulator